MTPSQLPPPPPPPIPAGLSPDEQQEYLRRFGLAQNVKHKTGAIYLRATACETLRSSVPLESFVEYVDQLLEEAGQPKDPIERMLLEQICLAHHAIGRLHAQASSAGTLNQARSYNAAVARLLAEFRRAVLALKKYREPTPTSNVVLVRQQNIAQHQQVALLDGKEAVTASKSPPASATTSGRDNKLASKKLEREYAPPQTFIPQPETRRRGEAELVEAKTPHC